MRYMTIVLGAMCVLCALVGPFLKWTPSTSAADAVRDWLNWDSAPPNLEWWLWFAAPLLTGLIAAWSLYKGSRVSSLALFPGAVFLLTWSAQVLTGLRDYTEFRHAGFMLTFSGVLGLTLLGLINCCQGNVYKETMTERHERRKGWIP